MAGKSNSSNYSILADVELDLRSIEKQLKSKKYNISIDDKGVKSTTNELDKLGKASKKAAEEAEELRLSYQEAQLVMQKSIETISAMVEQVFELDGAVTE